MAWPSIGTPQIILAESSRASTIRSPFEAGYMQTRARFTRMPKRFELHWNHLSAADLATLRTYYESTVVGGANAFDWTHPTTSTVYSCRFAEDELRFELQLGGYYKGSVILEQV